MGMSIRIIRWPNTYHSPVGHVNLDWSAVVIIVDEYWVDQVAGVCQLREGDPSIPRQDRIDDTFGTRSMKLLHNIDDPDKIIAARLICKFVVQITSDTTIFSLLH